MMIMIVSNGFIISFHSAKTNGQYVGFENHKKDRCPLP
jgi:hypothetical protein